jgi:hypothetical protein
VRGRDKSIEEEKEQRIDAVWGRDTSIEKETEQRIDARRILLARLLLKREAKHDLPYRMS